MLAAAVTGANAILPDMLNLYRERTASGVTILATPGTGPVTVEAWIGGGFGDEADDHGTTGLAHLGEHVALAVAGARLRETRVAVALDGWVTPDATVFRALAAAGDVDGAVEAVAFAAGAQDEVSAWVVAREQARIAREELDDVIDGDGTRGRADARDVAAWWRASYAPSRTTLAVRGGRIDDVVAAVDRRWRRRDRETIPLPYRVRGPSWRGNSITAAGAWRARGVDVSAATARERAALSLAGAVLRARGRPADVVVTRDAVVWVAAADVEVDAFTADDDALAWARAAVRVPLAGVETAIGEVAGGQHLFGDPAWTARWRAEIARVTPDDVTSAVRAHVAGRTVRAARRTPAPPPRRPARRVVTRETLAGGLRVVAMRVPGADRVAVRVAWSRGFASEAPADRGVVALLAAAAPVSCGEVDAAAETAALGGELAGVAGRWTFGLRSRWTAAAWKDGLALLAACVRTPALDADVIARERARLVALATDVAASPSRLARMTYLRARWGGDPLGNDALASPAELASLTRASAARWWREHYTLGAAVVVVAGDVDPDVAIDEVKARFALPPGAPTGGVTAGAETSWPRSPSPAPAQLFVDGPADMAAIVIGLPGLPTSDADRRVLDGLVAILGEPGGRLRAAAAAHGARIVRVAAVDGPVAGYVVIEVAADPPADAALAAIEASVRALGRDGPAAAEVAVAHAALAPADDLLAIADALARAELHRAPAPAPLPAPLDADTLQRVAASVLRWDDATIVTVRPPAMTPGARDHAGKRVKPARRTRHGARR